MIDRRLGSMLRDPQRIMHRYLIEMGECVLDIPEGSRFVGVTSENYRIYLWVELVPHNEAHRFRFRTVGLGDPVPDGTTYIGTVEMRRLGSSPGVTVWHVYMDLTFAGEDDG
jgi:hypothetical protein